MPAARAKIVYAPDPVGGMLSEAVAQGRKAEERAFLAAGDDPLTGTKYVGLYGREKPPPAQQERFDSWCSQRLQTGRACAIKEMCRDFWVCATGAEDRRFCGCWDGWAVRSRRGPITNSVLSPAAVVLRC
jgi:hypothetical protein